MTRPVAPLADAGKDEGVAKEVNRLSGLPLTELRSEWHRWHPERQMPQRLSRDLLVRTIAWKLQEQTFGRCPPILTRKLERLASQLERSGTLDLEREAHLRPGTALVREWQGQTYRVTATNDGFLYDGRAFESLSEIARTITGTRWSGPRFFGLKQRSGRGRSQLSVPQHGE